MVTTMTVVEKENFINQLLIFMNNTLEENGQKIDGLSFNFLTKPFEIRRGSEVQGFAEGEDFAAFKAQNPISNEDFNTILNMCLTREYIKRFRGDSNGAILLTEDGRARAISAVMQQYYTPKETSGDTVFHGPVNIHNSENVQLGSSNTQNIKIIRDNILNEIDKLSASKEEKDRAKNIVMEFFNDALVQGAVDLGKCALRSVGVPII